MSMSKVPCTSVADVSIIRDPLRFFSGESREVYDASLDCQEKTLRRSSFPFRVHQLFGLAVSALFRLEDLPDWLLGVLPDGRENSWPSVWLQKENQAWDRSKD